MHTKTVLSSLATVCEPVFSFYKRIEVVWSVLPPKIDFCQNFFSEMKKQKENGDDQKRHQECFEGTNIKILFYVFIYIKAHFEIWSEIGRAKKAKEEK